MIIGLLIGTIGIIPIILAISMKSLYKESNLSTVLIAYMLLITTWQFDVGILHFQNILDKKTILILFKLFRLGPTFSIPVAYYMAYRIIKNQPAKLKATKWFSHFLRVLFNQKVFWLLVIWSSFIYVVNWTPYGIKGLRLTGNDSLVSYFPIYGPLEWLYMYHVGSFILFLILVFIISGQIMTSNFRRFLRAFSIYSLFLFISGLINFVPKVEGVPSSIGVIFFSTMIIREFIMFITTIKSNYYELMEKQKKLDYTGNLAASLIHEVKNTNQIIKGFSNMLVKSKSISERDKSFLEMIQKASDYFEDLANNYREYMKASKVAVKKEAVDLIIQQSIEFSNGLMNDRQVEIKFDNPFSSLNAIVNKANLEQVFINLIKNSIEAMPDDRMNKKITISTEIEKDMILIHFKDTGKGIPQENWESVFDPFMTFKEGGMGLGLPYIKKIIIEHLGNIEIVESSDKGTHFKIELPQNWA